MDQSYKLNLFLGCVVILDLYLFQDIVLLNLCFKLSKDLTLLFIEQAIIGKLRLVLVVKELLLLSYYDVLSICSLLPMINQALLQNSPKVNQDIARILFSLWKIRLYSYKITINHLLSPFFYAINLALQDCFFFVFCFLVIWFTFQIYSGL